MKMYRWYSDTISMGGVTVAPSGATTAEIEEEVKNYILDTFDDMKFISKFKENPEISVWLIEEDDDFNECYPGTIATHY